VLAVAIAAWWLKMPDVPRVIVKSY